MARRRAAQGMPRATMPAQPDRRWIHSVRKWDGLYECACEIGYDHDAEGKVLNA